MCLKMFFLMCYVVADIVSAASVYDQSQTGNLNVQIDLKDLQVIALTKSGKEEYVDYDYVYDYSEMTIKPQNGTTPKPLNVTAADGLKDNDTIATTSFVETTTELIKSSSEKPPDADTTTENAIITSTTTIRSVKYKNTKHTTKKPDAIVVHAPSSANLNNSNCTRGSMACSAQNQNKSILELLQQRLKRRDHKKSNAEN